MNEEKVLEECIRFRTALIACRDELDPVFRNFPRGCCGDSAALLAAFLKDRGLGVFEYVSGQSDGPDWASHAWLQQDKTTVDITADQFDPDNNRPILSIRDPWYQRFKNNREERCDGDFRLEDDLTVARLMPCYEKILETINQG